MTTMASQITSLTVVYSTHDVYNARMAETYLATANYVWPAAVDTLPLVKT